MTDTLKDAAIKVRRLQRLLKLLDKSGRQDNYATCLLGEAVKCAEFMRDGLDKCVKIADRNSMFGTYKAGDYVPSDFSCLSRFFGIDVFGGDSKEYKKAVIQQEIARLKAST